MPSWLAVSTGGAIGAVGRYGVAELAGRAEQESFPWETLAVNLTGSFLLALLLGLLGSDPRLTTVRLLFGTGLLGAFTTFSTFSLETATLIRSDAWSTAMLYVGASLSGGLLFAMAGAIVAGRIRHRAKAPARLRALDSESE